MNRREQILEKLKEMGVEPKRSLGQNFLVADQTIEKILFAAKQYVKDSIIEVGPGLGALTDGLLEFGKKTLLIELDRDFSKYWRDKGIEVIEADALQVDWKTLALPEGTLLVSNLPYQISSSVVVDRSVEPAGVSTMILMFQKEVAQRLVAKAKTKDYGLLTVIAQTFWDVRFLVEAAPGAFYPQPNVASRVLTFRRQEPKDLQDPNQFLKFVKAAFAQRRKLLTKNLLTGFFNGDKSKAAAIEKGLQEIGAAPMARAEELDPAQFVRLYSLLKEAK
jgi:16S rRNA (adenine1518-N6/adenine1519-N6)-dimethyltransferase